MQCNKSYTFPSNKISISEKLNSALRVMLVRYCTCKMAKVLYVFPKIFKNQTQISGLCGFKGYDMIFSHSRDNEV